MIQHMLYKSDSIYLAHSISATDMYTPSMQDNPSKQWQGKLHEFGGYVADMASRAKASHVQFVVIALPRHAQAVMIAANVFPSGLNPYSFGDQLKEVVENAGGVYIDVLREFRNVPNVNSAFYPVDQHLTVAGHAIFANAIAKGLTSGAIAALSAPSQQFAIGEKSR